MTAVRETAAAPVRDRPLPAGTPLAAALRAFWRKQEGEVLARLRSTGIPVDAPRLDHWSGAMAEAAVPLLLPTFQRAYVGTRNQLARRQGRKSVASALFARLHPRALEFLRHWAFVFCDETNRTTQGLLTTAFRKLRRALAAGLEEGEGVRETTRQVARIFRDPQRARVIARTESARVVHGGEIEAAKESGVVKAKRWLTSSDACDVCRELDNRIVGLEDDFAVEAGGGPYAHVAMPPRHPNCRCTIVMVVDPRYL